MKKIIVLYIILCFTLTCNCFADVYTSDQLIEIVAKECKIEKDFIITTDEVYQDYNFGRALLRADSNNFLVKSNLFDCDDIAKTVCSIVIRHISELNSFGGAAMVGLAFLNLPNDKHHVINILVEENEVYLYDWQTALPKNMLNSAEYYLKKDQKFVLIWF